MAIDEALAALARAHGVALSYLDVWGRECEAARDGIVAALGAMGVVATDAAAIAAARAAHEADGWRSVLPPVHLHWEDARGPRLRVHLPSSADTATLQWGIDEEGGAPHRGEVAARKLPEVARGEPGGQPHVARELALALTLPCGYHRLWLAGEGLPRAACLLIVAPRRCYAPEALEGNGRVWGLAAQLYALRSERNWGIGDYSDLAALVELCGLHGGSIVGVNPLHLPFSHDPTRASPYAPSSRCLLNTQYLDIEAIAEYRECEAARVLVHAADFQLRLAALRAQDLVDHAGVAAVKREVLDVLCAHFLAQHLQRDTPRAREFGAWRAQGGEVLRRVTVFEAIQEHLHRADPSVWGWPAWPAELRDPGSAAVEQLAQQLGERVNGYAYLQWLCEQQLGSVGRRSFQLGLGVGLYQDLAVSVDRGGADVWAHQDLYCADVSVGAPPDEFNPAGQDWGLPPFDPRRLRRAGYAPFIAALRANMRHAGALRIDHVMALSRLFWVPPGRPASQGVYVHYPFEEMLGIVALESQRNRCLVVGEDLGTVPDEIRTRLAQAGVLSYRLLYFERDERGGFIAPPAWPPQALAAATTHDLPTLAGWWEGRDLRLRAALGHFPSAELRERQVVERAQDRARLLLALAREELLPPGGDVNPVSLPVMTPAFCQAIHEWLALTPARIVLAQLEDIVGAPEPVNVPGTTDEHPNWRRKLPLALERWAGDQRFVALARRLEGVRGGARRASARRETPTAVIPRATYRVQLNRDFRFADARALVPYLARLGVSHLYCSPFLRARPGSRHGYDIIDHNQFNPEIGNRDDFEELAATLKKHGMGMLIDVVPNHMGVLGADNGWWMDVLENGPASLYAEFFDIDWQVVDPALAGRVLLPILGDQYGVVLERGELELVFEARAGSLVLRYHEHRLPIDPALYPRVLSAAQQLLPSAARETGAAEVLASLVSAFGHLPPRDSRDATLRAERHRDKEVHKAALARLAREWPPLIEAIDAALAALNGDPQHPGSFDALDRLVDAQAYRVAFWRVAADEINYRRFFDINELAALRMEDPQVFDAAHRLVLDLAASGRVDGLRIDHVDGLYDPAGYLRRLQQRYVQLAGAPGAATTAEGDRPARPLYVVVEKIVAPHERLPLDWAVHGTTGYRFAAVAGGLFVDTAARLRLERAWRAFVGDEARDFDELATECRRLVMRTSLAGELSVLAMRLHRLARADRHTRDFTFASLRQALAEVVAHFPVYRTYIVERAAAEDRHSIDWAVSRARRRTTVADASVFDFIHRVLLGARDAEPDGERDASYLAFTRRLQQFTAPVTAKGIEDTAFYRHHRLSSLNEVGGGPETFGTTVTAFHGASRDRARHWSTTMLATSTHDTKRSEDVRLRLAVISEMPAAWRLSVRRWSRLNRSHRREVDGQPAPARNDEYLLYQTLVGTWPGDVDAAALVAYRARVDAFMRKALREAKVRTSWLVPNPAYEEALSKFIEGLLGRLEGNPFLDDLRSAAATFAWYGALNGVALAAIKFTSPGVPDIYQGMEMIELALVDPDNRRPVDHGARRRELDALQAVAGKADVAPAVRKLMATAVDGRAKLWTIWRALQLRRERPALFAAGDYRAVAVHGARARHVLAYARVHGEEVLMLVAGRLFASLGLAAGEPPIGPVWGDTSADLSFIAAPCRLTEVLTGTSFDVDPQRPLPLARLLAHFPAAILHGTVASR